MDILKSDYKRWAAPDADVFMNLCPQMRFLFLFSLCTRVSSWSRERFLSGFRLPDCTGSNPLGDPWCLAVNSVSQSWHYTSIFLPWITDVVMELISKILNTSSGLCQALFCSVQALLQSWLELSSCWAAQWPHTCVGQWPTARTWGRQGMPCLHCRAVQHHLVSHLLL